MQEFTPIKEGKVREVYDNGDSLIIVATDRISAFDHILKNKITKKGAILTQMSKFWFDYTKDVLPNHMISVDVKDMPEFFQNEKYDGNSMMCKKLEMLPIECIVRGYITGSGWASYKENGTVCGIKLPDGLQESCLNRSIHQVLRLILETMMRISLLNRVLKYWRRSILEKVKSMLPKSRKQPLLYIRNVQNTH